MEQEFHRGLHRTPKSKPKRKRVYTSSYSLSTPKSWMILPERKYEEFHFFLSLLKGNTYLSKVEDLENDTFFYPHLSKEEQVQKKQQIRKILLWNQNLRWMFKRFQNRWRLNHVRKMNDTDPFTLTTFENPVHVYSLERRIQYTFEAASILRDFHKKLTHNDGQIPSPIPLKNPLTNEIFTFQQLLSLFRQCKEKGYSTWATESFKAVKFSIDMFLSLNRKHLRILAVESVLKDIHSWQGFELLFDFIRIQHLDHQKQFDKGLYIWAMRNGESVHLIKQWKEQCKAWYISSILEDDPMRLVSVQEKIYRTTRELCDAYSFLVEEKKRISKA